MPSTAHQNFLERLTEIDQLLDAHSALTRLRRAEQAWESSAQGLGDVATVINHLVTEPGRGRRYEVQALNSSAIALLSGHLQGFITEIYEECAQALLEDSVANLETLIQAAPTRGNPNEQNINRLFNTIGFGDIISDISWNRMSSENLKRKLREFNELRNRIVHGRSETVTKQIVANYLSVWRNFAAKLDSSLRQKVRTVAGNPPW